MGVIDGEGTQKNPLKYAARHAINQLIKDARSTGADIMKSGPGLSRFNMNDDLKTLLEFLQLRVHITARRNMQSLRDPDPTPGTQLLDVHLHGAKTHVMQKFEHDIAHISGVVEWDRIEGFADYLVRVVKAPNGGDNQSIKDQIQEMDNVASVKSSQNYKVVRSGIVDNIEADMFLNIAPDPNNA